MFRTEFEKHEAGNNFYIYVKGEPKDVLLGVIRWPIMGREELDKFIAGEDTEDHDENGFHVVQRDGEVAIIIDYDHIFTEFRLPHEACVPAFKQMIPAYNQFNSEEHLNCPILELFQEED